MKKLISVAIAGLLLVNMAIAQSNESIKDYLNSYIGENAEPYIQPLADIFTSTINTGVWEWSKIDSDLYLRVKVQAMVSFPSEAMRTFVGRTTGDFEPEQTVVVPTIVGDRSSVIVQGNDNTVYVFPGGYDLKRITLGTPQITLGGFLNSEISGRFLAFPLSDDLGKVRFYGIGGRHSLSNYFTDSPVDFSVGYFYQHTEAGNYLNTNQHLISASLGASNEIFSGQLTAGYQASVSDVHYTYDDGDTEYNVDLNLENKNPWIMEASLGLRLGPLMASGAVSYAKHVSVAVGAGLFF